MATSVERKDLPDGLREGFADLIRNCDLTEIEADCLIGAAVEAIENRYGIALRPMTVSWQTLPGKHVLPFRPFGKAKINIEADGDFCAFVEGDDCACAVEATYVTGAYEITAGRKLGIWKVAESFDDGDDVNWRVVDQLFKDLMVPEIVRFYAGPGGLS